MNITLRQIEVFLAVATYSHVGKAAESLNISQSAVSMALSLFEDEVKEKLFERASRRIFLNDSGKMLLPIARKVYEAAQELENFKTDAKVRGKLKIGASTTIGNYLMPFVIGSFMEENHDIEVVMFVGNTADILRMILVHEIDLGFIEGPVDDADVKELFWREDKLTVFAPNNYPDNVYYPADTQWLMREKGSGTRDVFEASMKEAGLGFKIKMELGHTEAIKKAVEAGLGISCLSELAIGGELKRGVVKRLHSVHADFKRSLNMIIRKDKYLTHSLQTFMDYCMKENVKTAGYPD